MSPRPPTAPIAVLHNEGATRFEASIDGALCVCVYRRMADTVAFTHTEVPPQLEGRGIAAAMVRCALAWARAEGLRVRPLCSYVALYMRRHPEVADLLASGTSG